MIERWRTWSARKATPEELLSLVLLVFVSANFLYGAVLSRIDPPEKNDFTAYYVAAQVLLRGMPEALYYPDPVGSLLAQASVQHPWIDVAVESGVANPNYYLYPPLFAVTMLPLAFVPYATAFAIWLGVNVGFLAASLALFLAGRRKSLMVAAACVVVAGTFHPIWHHLKIGQSSLLVLFLLALTLRLLLRGRDAAAGFALAGAILLKLTPGILLVLLAARRRWNALAAAVAGVLLLSLISSLVAGVGPQMTYFGEMVPLLGAGTAFYPNQSLNGLITRLLGLGDYRKADLSLDLAAPRILGIVGGLVVIGLSMAAVIRRRREGSPEAIEDGFAALVIASLMASPISWEHHYVLALLPAWILIRRWGMQGAAWRGGPLVAGSALALAGSYVSMQVFEKFGPGPMGPLMSSSALLGGGILWWLFIGGRSAGAGPGSPGSSGSGKAPGIPERGGAAALLMLVAAFLSIQFLFKVAEYNTSFQYGDFTSYYVAGAAVLEGEGEHLYAPRTGDMILAKAEEDSPWRRLADSRAIRDVNYYLYPPFFAVAAAPLGWLDYGTAHDLWYILNLACLAGALALFPAAGEGARALGLCGLLALTALFWPSLFTFGAGQANYVILFLVLAALRGAESGRDWASGLALAGAAAIKITPALLLGWFLWKRRYRLVAWGAAGFVAISLSGLPFTGVETYRIYAAEMVPLLSQGCAHWVNQSLQAFLSRMSGAGMFDWSLSPGQGWVIPAVRGASLAVVVLLAWITRGRAGIAENRLGFALVLITTLFLSPISWIHHSVMTLPAIFILARHLATEGRLTWGRGALIALAYTLVAIYFKPPGIFQEALLIPLASYHLAGNFILWALLAAELRQARRAALMEGTA